MIWQSTADASCFAPFPASKVEVLEGQFHEMVHIVRAGATELGALEVGVSVTDRPSKVRYRFEGDHTVYIIYGNVTVELENGCSTTLGPGDIASFPKGATCIWTVVAPTKEIYVVSG